MHISRRHPLTTDRSPSFDHHRGSCCHCDVSTVCLLTVDDMQAVPVPVVAASSYPSVLPGPFILLLVLPIIPLLLFSVGARPPDTSRLPFSTDDLWQTTAFISVAGAVVLCVGLYPGAFSEVAHWVTDGGAPDVGRWWGDLRGGAASTPAVERQRSTHQAQHQHGRVQRQVQPSTRQNSHARRPTVYQNGRPVYGPPSNALPIPVPQYESQGSLAARHVTALREGMGSWYNPSRPSPLIPLLLIFPTAALLIITLGKVLGSAYDADAKSSSRSGSAGSSSNEEPWPSREMRKRKSEKERETKARVEKEIKNWKEKLGKMSGEDRAKAMERRKKEVEKVKAELEKREMSTKGVELYLGSSKGKGDKKDKNEKQDKEEKKVEKNSKAGSRDRISTSAKVKSFFLGPPDTLLRSKSGGESSKKVNTVNDVPAQGPGWKAADEAVAHAAIRGGAARAENLGNQLVAERNG